MSWRSIETGLPINGQWVVIRFGDGFKAGQYEANHPFAPAVVDRHAGKYFQFSQWLPIDTPPQAE